MCNFPSGNFPSHNNVSTFCDLKFFHGIVFLDLHPSLTMDFGHYKTFIIKLLFVFKIKLKINMEKILIEHCLTTLKDKSNEIFKKNL